MVSALARELGADAEVTERVYRTMIAAFIEAELAEHRALTGACREVRTAHPAPRKASPHVTRKPPTVAWV